MRILTSSNFLTFFKVIISPLMFPLLIVSLLPYNSLFLNICLAVIFVFLSFTDFLDGFFAKTFHQEIKLGKLLGPVADKILFSSTLIALSAANKIFFYWVIILIGCEFFVLGLRLIASEKGRPLAVSFFGKIKKITQIAFLALVIINPYHSAGFTYSWNALEYLLLGALFVLSLWSAKNDFSCFMEKVVALDASEAKFNDNASNETFEWDKDSQDEL
ncbi:CDP-alcohol phosphatidyltransferase family protein [bacterium]|nr:CDP-alcohol phosphatidyltransferase family protein [bacterium]